MQSDALVGLFALLAQRVGALFLAGDGLLQAGQKLLSLGDSLLRPVAAQNERGTFQNAQLVAQYVREWGESREESVALEMFPSAEAFLFAYDEDKKEKLLEDGTLMKTPVVRNGRQATVEYCPEVWEKWE